LITAPRVTQTPFQEITTRQTTDQITRQRTKETPYKEITKIIIPGGGGFTLPSGTDTGRQRGRSKSPFREVIGIKSMFAEATKIKKRRKS
jgi:hypothetical protein